MISRCRVGAEVETTRPSYVRQWRRRYKARRGDHRKLLCAPLRHKSAPEPALPTGVPAPFSGIKSVQEAQRSPPRTRTRSTMISLRRCALPMCQTSSDIDAPIIIHDLPILGRELSDECDVLVNGFVVCLIPDGGVANLAARPRSRAVLLVGLLPAGEHFLREPSAGEQQHLHAGQNLAPHGL
jgi:hypothetical protein